MPNVANRENPPKGMVFVYLKNGEATIGASRNPGYNNVWFKLLKDVNTSPRKIRLAHFSGCRTEYGIQLDGGDSKFPMIVNEVD